MSDLPAFLVGVIPFILVVVLVYIIVRTLPLHHRPQGKAIPVHPIPEQEDADGYCRCTTISA
jgi:hypothetical protein